MPTLGDGAALPGRPLGGQSRAARPMFADSLAAHRVHDVRELARLSTAPRARAALRPCAALSREERRRVDVARVLRGALPDQIPSGLEPAALAARVARHVGALARARGWRGVIVVTCSETIALCALVVAHGGGSGARASSPRARASAARCSLGALSSSHASTTPRSVGGVAACARAATSAVGSSPATAPRSRRGGEIGGGVVARDIAFARRDRATRSCTAAAAAHAASRSCMVSSRTASSTAAATCEAASSRTASRSRAAAAAASCL